MGEFTVYGLQFTVGKSKGEKNIQHLPFYSFWFYDCIYLAWMRKKGWIGKAVTRAHGGDLFEERGSLGGKILFRNFQLKYLDKVLSVSQTGTSYLQNKYSNYSKKIDTSYLGSPHHDYLNPINNGERFVLVSCAKVRNIKRIHKIAEMLQFIDFPLTWYHIGDENIEAKNDSTIAIYKENKEKLKAKSNIQFVAQGNISNEEILAFYKETPIDLFISLSEAEGVPVSMMEAISFGIPILSTDVGGCKEIVTEQTGILIPLETSMEKVAQIITDFRNTYQNTPEFRLGVRKFWEEKFDADKNYKALFDLIIEE
jgi:glycosyltransferase involved in cell wall biosynthesis